MGDGGCHFSNCKDGVDPGVTAVAYLLLPELDCWTAGFSCWSPYLSASFRCIFLSTRNALYSSVRFVLQEASCRESWTCACRRRWSEFRIDWCDSVSERREIATSLLDVLSSAMQLASIIARHRRLVICVFDARTIFRQEVRVVLPRKRDEEIQAYPPRRVLVCARFAFIVCYDRAAQLRAH